MMHKIVAVKTNENRITLRISNLKFQVVLLQCNNATICLLILGVFRINRYLCKVKPKTM